MNSKVYQRVSYTQGRGRYSDGNEETEAQRLRRGDGHRVFGNLHFSVPPIDRGGVLDCDSKLSSQKNPQKTLS